jgi:aryl carrier-like protein
MQQRHKINRSDYQLSFFPELETVFPGKENKPLIRAFIHLDNKINNQQYLIDQGLKSIDIIQQVQKTMKVDIKKDLYMELATKADINELRGEMKADINELRGELKADINELRGEMLTGFEKITGEINSRYTELDGKIQTKHEELLGEMQTKHEELRGEMQTKHEALRGEIQVLRGEMQTKHEELRGEMQTKHEELRGEMIAGFEMIRSDINNLRTWFKVFAFSALLIVFMFSPNFIQLLKYVKLF